MSETGNLLQRLSGVDAPSSMTAGGRTLPSANNAVPYRRSTSRNWPNEERVGWPWLQKRHHLLRRSATMIGLGEWEGGLKAMGGTGKVTPMSVPRVVLLSWKNDPVDYRKNKMNWWNWKGKLKGILYWVELPRYQDQKKKWKSWWVKMVVAPIH